MHLGLIFLSSLNKKKKEDGEEYNINICMWVCWTIDEGLGLVFNYTPIDLLMHIHMQPGVLFLFQSRSYDGFLS